MQTIIKSQKVPQEKGLPEYIRALFWDFDPQIIDINKHSDLIISRIMERGSWQSMQWLQRTYSPRALKNFLERRGKKILPLRELNYWTLILNISQKIRRQWKSDREEKNVWEKRISPQHT